MSLSLGMTYDQFLILKLEVLFLPLTFISPTRDSPKKARAKEPSSPSKISKSARQLIFDDAVYVPVLLLDFKKLRGVFFSSDAAARLPVSKGEKAKALVSSKSPSKAAPQ
jgi:hypothetical protein